MSWFQNEVLNILVSGYLQYSFGKIIINIIMKTAFDLTLCNISKII